jgi:hypothetical protein
MKEDEDNKNDFFDQDLNFNLWKAELNKYLIDFWKSMSN